MTTPILTPADVLRAAREKIAKPENWTRHVLARDSHGRSVRPRDPAATCFCMSGAIMCVFGPSWSLAVFQPLIDSVSDPIPTWNDHPDRTHADVLFAFDRAIALADEAGS